MREIWISIFFLTYTIGQVISYLPQIIKTIRTKEAEDISLASWGIWIIVTVARLGYVLLVTPDWGNIIMSVSDIVFCLLVYFITFYYQKLYKK